MSLPPEPPELPKGQDDDPDLAQLLKVLARELGELREPGSELDADTRLRLGALWRVIQRVRGEL